MHIATNLGISEQIDILAEFISADIGNYYDGMENLAISHLYNEKANQGRCSFFDAYYVNGNIRTLNQELSGQAHPVVVTSPINVYADERLAPANNRRAHCDMLKNTLNAISHCDKNFSKVFIPIGCQEERCPGHNIALVLEKDTVGFKATILDQMGGASYSDTKARVIQDLESVGVVNIDYNRYPISHNRNDCATITSLLADLACDDNDMRDISKATDGYYAVRREPQIGISVIDAQQENDQNVLVVASDKLAENLIIETYSVSRLDQLRGIAEVPSPRDITIARINKFRNARQHNSLSRNDYVR